jgi:hypothetical protein
MAAIEKVVANETKVSALGKRNSYKFYSKASFYNTLVFAVTEGMKMFAVSTSNKIK